MAIFILHVGVIHFLRSFISSLRGDHFIPPWGFENFHVDILDFQPRKRKVPPLELKSSKRGTVFGTRIYYRVSTIRVTLCRGRSLSLVSRGMTTVSVKNHNAVTFDTTDAHTYDSCRDARSERQSPLKGTSLRSFYNGRTDRASLHGNVSLYYNGRTDRASLQGIVTTVHPYKRLLVSLYYNGRPLAKHEPCVPTRQRLAVLQRMPSR